MVCMYVCMYVSGGVANVFYQSCAQIDNNQQVYEVQIQVPKCNSILKAGVKSRVHFILIDVRVSTQTTDQRQLTLHN
jgi:saccharopine dehydrogenase-like NADP-dependent oxidoreductase